MKTGFNNLSADEIEEVNDALDPWAWEHYCTACDYYPWSAYADQEEFKCPYKHKVTDRTKWREELHCNYFCD